MERFRWQYSPSSSSSYSSYSSLIVFFSPSFKNVDCRFFHLSCLVLCSSPYFTWEIRFVNVNNLLLSLLLFIKCNHWDKNVRNCVTDCCGTKTTVALMSHRYSTPLVIFCNLSELVAAKPRDRTTRTLLLSVFSPRLVWREPDYF